LSSNSRRSQDQKPAVAPPAAPAPVDSPSKTAEFLQAPPTIELPKGGGAVRGIGEKFQANPVTGTAGMSVPLGLPPGRGGFTPALSLSYSSGAGNGPFGMGWVLSIPSVRRKTDKGLPQYRDAIDSDTFVLSDVEDLVPWLDVDGSGNWSKRSVSYTDADGDGEPTWS
jgi:hypothetical protein